MAIFSGDIFAENYTVSSSVTNVQISSVSGSTKSGDSTDDIHQFTGSMGILHAGSNESQTGLLIKNSQGSNNSSARLLLQGNGGDYGTIGAIASRNTNASYDDVDYARIEFALPGTSMTTHGIEFYTGDGGAATKKFEIHGNKISGSSTSTGSFGRAIVNTMKVGNGAEIRNISANHIFGYNSLTTNTGNYNIAIGTEVMMAQTSGERNTGVGYQAGRSNVTGDYNTFMGFSAGRGTTSGVYSSTVGIGYNAFYTIND